jgi:hypothetical protein
MAHNLTESGTTFPATVQVPDDGDDLVDQSVETGMQALADRTQYLKGNLPNGLLSGGTSLSTIVGTPNTVRINRITCLVIGGKAYATGGETGIGSAVLEGGGAFGNHTWYYVYAYISAGAIAWQISTTPPESGRTWKAGAEGTHAYIGCFRTNGSGNIIPFRAERGTYQYNINEAPLNATLFLTFNGATAITATNLYPSGSSIALMPPHARLARVYARLTFAAEVQNVGAQIYGSTTGAGTFTASLSVNVNEGVHTLEFGIETSATQQLAYVVSGLGSGGQLYLWLYGWQE